MPIAVPVGREPRGRALYARAIPKSAILTVPAPREQEVLRLEVAVGDALALRVAEPGEHALDHPADLRQLEPADQLAQRAAATYSIAM